MRINHEVGCIFDMLTFFSTYIEAISMRLPTGIYVEQPSLYHEAKQYILQNNITLPRYLYPFLCRLNNTDSFLHTIFFDCEYNKCTFIRLQNIMKNRQYMQRCFIKHCIPNADDQTISDVIRLENPDFIDRLAQHYTDRISSSYFYYIIVNFEKVMRQLNDVFQSVYSCMDTLRRSMMSDLYAEALKNESVFHKLKAITNSTETNYSNFTVSLSFMDTDILSYRPDERNFVLLGCDFEKKLDTDYKYCDVTLYSFARAIGNLAKNDIFNALLHKSPMTMAELGKQLSLSRNELAYNIKDMIENRILIADPINKRAFQYRLDYEYLRIVSGQLDSICRFT